MGFAWSLLTNVNGDRELYASLPFGTDYRRPLRLGLGQGGAGAVD
jgi:hypothetical protein